MIPNFFGFAKATLNSFGKSISETPSSKWSGFNLKSIECALNKLRAFFYQKGFRIGDGDERDTFHYQYKYIVENQ